MMSPSAGGVLLPAARRGRGLVCVVSRVRSGARSEITGETVHGKRRCSPLTLDEFLVDAVLLVGRAVLAPRLITCTFHLQLKAECQSPRG